MKKAKGLKVLRFRSRRNYDKRNCCEKSLNVSQIDYAFEQSSRRQKERHARINLGLNAESLYKTKYYQ
jgi:hypothetical protein